MRAGVLVLVAVLVAAAPTRADSRLVTRPHANRGDLWGSVGSWFSGRWWDPRARGYIREVKHRLEQRTSRTRDFRGG